MPNTILIFDLDTSAAFQKSGSKTAPYGRFRRFAESRGFRHLQGSAYISVKAMDREQILGFLQHLADELPWFSRIVRRAKIYQVANDFDVEGRNTNQLNLPL